MDPLAICNRALGWLGTKRISKLDEGSRNAELCSENFDAIRDAVNEAREWTFAVARLELQPDAAPPSSGFAKRYKLPGNVLRVLQADDQKDGSNWLVWAREGDCIVTDYAGVLYVRALVRIEDLKLWSPNARVALAYRLASMLAVPVTENRSLGTDYWQMYDRELRNAAALDGMQGRNQSRRSSLSMRRY